MRIAMRPFFAAMAAAFVAAGAAKAGSFTYVSPTELFLTGDFDGNGRPDVAIVDRQSGIYRIGYQIGGVDTWAPARASGVEDVTGSGAGKLFATDRDALVFASTTANRVNVIAADDTAVPGLPRAVFTPGIGPAATAVLEIGGAGNTAHEDLFVGTAEPEPLVGVRRVLVRNTGGSFSNLVSSSVFQIPTSANPVRPRTGAAQHLALMDSSDGTVALRLYSVASGSATFVGGVTNISERLYAHGIFGGGTLARFLFYTYNSPRLVTRALQEPLPGVFAFGAPVTNTLAGRIRQLIVLESTPPRLLVVGPLDTPARVYSYDGTNAPVVLQEVTVPDGEEFTGAIPLPGGNFKLFSGSSGFSSRFHNFRLSGGSYVADGSGDLPGRNVLGTPANVFLFAEEPFVSLAPRLVASLNAADWSRSVGLGGADISVQAERFGSSSQGLDNPTGRNLGPKPAGANRGLPNQFAESMSLASFQPAIGDEVEDLNIFPAAGPQTKAITVTIRSVAPAMVSFRVDSGTWRSSSNSVSFTLYRDSTVYYFARPFSGDRKGPIRTARYTFPGPPDQQDSDGDGVPDFVEIARGLDPNGGGDSDGDGLSDRTELLRGFDPNNRGCTNCPESNINGRALVENAAFELFVSPRPMNGPTGTEVAPLLDQRVLLHDLSGGILDQSLTRNNPSALFNPSARFTNAPADVSSFMLTTATDSNFEINTAGADKAIGRELLSLVPVPYLESPVFNFTPSSGSLAAQAAEWIQAASNALVSATKPVVAVRSGVAESLTALLVERKLHDLLAVRGDLALNATNRLTLFGFRFGDAALVRPTPAALKALESLGPDGEPAWRITSVHAAISNGVATATGARIRTLAEEIYRISSLSNNAAPGRFPSPVDTLRSFLRTGVLHSNYAAVISIPTAFDSANVVLALPTRRPTNSFVLEVRADSFSTNLTRLYVISGPLATNTPVNLFVAPRVAYKFPNAFNLIPGSRVSVLAFTDFSDPAPGEDLQVLHAELQFVPAPAIVDSNGNLLPDAWENLFFAGAGDAGSDSDGDGFSNLQEYLDGSDPRDGISMGVVAYNLVMPPLVLEMGGGGAVKVKFSFPAAYADRFVFRLFASTDLSGGFEAVNAAPALQGGQYELNLPSFPSAGGFFYVTQSLRQ
jgi:hypothetical protein